MHGMCSKCAQAAEPACGCPSQGPPMPELMSMPMVGAPPSAAPMSDSDKGKMREAAKSLLSKLQDLDFDKVDSFDLKIVMSGDAEELEGFAEPVEDSGNSENVADISSDEDSEEKDEEKD